MMKRQTNLPRMAWAAALLLFLPPLGAQVSSKKPIKKKANKPAKQFAPFKIDFQHRPKEEKDYKVAKWGPKDFESKDLAIFARRVLPVATPPIEDGVVLVHRGKIVGVGPASEVTIPDGYQKIDLGDGWLLPGFVDLHCHIAGAGWDLNDTVHPTNPEFRTLDLVGIHHPQIKRALAGGVTSVLYIPGSGSNSGGFGTLTKTAGRTASEALIRFPGSLKVAQAGNPERRAGDMGAGRIGMNFGLRAMFERGRAYYKKWEDYDAGKLKNKPEFKPGLEYLRGLFRNEYPVSVHTQAYQVCLETLRELHDEFGLWTFVDHGTFDAYRLAGEAYRRGVPIALGPRQYQMDRDTSHFIGLAAGWALGGGLGWPRAVPGVGPNGIAINTDAPVVPQEELSVQAAMAVRLGLPDSYAIRGLTINPAHFIGADHRIGSIEVGKDADLVLWNGDPLDPRHYVRRTMVNGTFYYNCDPGGKDHNRRRF